MQVHDLTITELAAACRAGTLTPVDATRQCLERIDRLDGTLHAFTQITRERAIAEAEQAHAELQQMRPRGPLHGIPYAAKEHFDVEGVATMVGCRFLSGNIAKEDCAAVRRLQEAGMILIGKTHTVQFGGGVTGINQDVGTPHNPWHKVPHVPGGSSSGSAVAVAAGMVPAALGGDTGGSERRPQRRAPRENIGNRRRAPSVLDLGRKS